MTSHSRGVLVSHTGASTSPVDLRSLRMRPAVLALDFPRLFELESMSYPEDEAASESNMHRRCELANDFFKVFEYLPSNDVGSATEILGFINGTCIEGREIHHESMSNHDPTGRTLVIHSVTIDPRFRRQGLATRMLKNYLQILKEDNKIDYILLLSKGPIVTLYINCGFSVLRLSPIEHGKESWFELALDVAAMRLPDQLVVDAFTAPRRSGDSGAFTGNPAAVVFEQRSEEWMQQVAAENNLAETSFLRKLDSGSNSFSLRWFTPTREVELCGHATLAAAHALFTTGRIEKTSSLMNKGSEIISFHTKYSGILTAERFLDGRIALNFPSNPVSKSDNLTEEEIQVICAALSICRIDIVFVGRSIYDILVEVTANAFINVTPSIDFTKIASLGGRGLLLTSIGRRSVLRYAAQHLSSINEARISHTEVEKVENSTKKCLKESLEDDRFDFVSRCFFPMYGVNEDPFTGSAHCTLFPYWMTKLELLSSQHSQLEELVAYQASKRGGIVTLKFDDNRDRSRVVLCGSSTTTIQSKIVARF